MPIVQVRKLRLWPEKLAFSIALGGAGFERGPAFSSRRSVLSLNKPTCRLLLCRSVVTVQSSGRGSRTPVGAHRGTCWVLRPGFLGQRRDETGQRSLGMQRQGDGHGLGFQKITSSASGVSGTKQLFPAPSQNLKKKKKPPASCSPPDTHLHLPEAGPQEGLGCCPDQQVSERGGGRGWVMICVCPGAGQRGSPCLEHYTQE